MLMRGLYTLLMYLAVPFLLLRQLWRSRKHADYRHHLAERLGFLPFKLEHCIWVHAVSLGETIASKPLVQVLKAHYPSTPILLTHTTPTGREQGRKLWGDQVYQAYLPYDVAGFLNHFIKQVNPSCCLLMETELWPNLLAVLKQKNIPVALVNARLSERSKKRYTRIAKIAQNMMNDLSLIAAQSELDLKRFYALGLKAEHGCITGNLKFDVPITLPENCPVSEWSSVAESRPIWVAVSTHEQEHEQVLMVHKQVLEQLPNALLVIVPRHPEQFAVVAQKALTMGMTVQKRSDNKPPDSTTQVLVGDSMGELLAYISLGQVVFMGGSLVTVGGHNVLEPAALKRPVIIGPHWFNFYTIVQALQATNGIIIVDSKTQLATQVCQLLTHVEMRAELANAAYDYWQSHQGSAQRLLAALVDKNIV